MPQQAPILILGTAMWGWTTSPQQCFALLDYFYEAGFREIDAATNYPINKNPADFRKSEQILLEWIKANGINDLKVMIKVGSVNNLRTPEHNLQKSFLLVMLDEYRYLFGDNLDTFMIHWDNREDEQAIHASYEALQQAQQLGFRVGLSGIKHPAIHAKVNEQFQLDVRIQLKHNLLYSDYQRYAPFHGKQRFITYGINAGGLKLSPNAYHAGSSLKARGGDVDTPPPILAPLQELIANFNTSHLTQITHFNQCGMAYAYHAPEVAGILLGTSKVEQLKNSIALHQQLSHPDYQKLYQALVELVNQQQSA